MNSEPLKIQPIRDETVDLFVFNPGPDFVLRVRQDFTIELGENRTLDEASRAFWAAVQFDGRTLIERAEAAEAEVVRLRAMLGMSET